MDVNTAAILGGMLLLERNPITLRSNTPHTIVQYVVFGPRETPLPEGVSPTRIVEAPTGDLRVEQPAADLVRTAGSFLRALVVLPISEEDDAEVSALVSRRTAGRRSRPLRGSHA